MSHLSPIYYTADADIWCRECLLATYGTDDGPDHEGNGIGAVFSWDEGPDYCPHCNICHGALDEGRHPFTQEHCSDDTY